MKNKYPFTKQEGLKDCGAACMQMIIKYYDGYISIEDLNNLLETTKEGVSAYKIIETLKLLGFNAQGIKCKLEELNSSSFFLPAIAHVTIDKKYEHYVVIYNINFKKKNLVIADPQSKLKKLTFEEFNQIFNNIILTMYPVKPIEKRNINPSFKNYIISIILNLKEEINFLILSTFIYMILSLSISFYMKVLFDRIYFTRKILILIYTFFIISKLNQIAINYLRNKVLIILNMKVDSKISLNIFGKLLSLPYSYYRNKTCGEIITRYTELSKIREALNKIILTILLDLPLTIISCIVMYILSPKLLSIAIIIMLFYSIIVITFNKILKINIEKVQCYDAEKNSILVESINSFDTIKGLKIEKNINKKFEHKYIKYLKQIAKTDELLNIQTSLKTLVGEVGEMTLLFIGILLVKEGEISIGTLLSFNSISGFFLAPIKNLLNLDYTIIEAKKIIKRISEMTFDEDETKKIYANGNIKIEKLTFSRASKIILKDININISKGEKVIITGQSGSGKSTLLKILMNYYKDYEGRILVDNHNINGLDLKINYISQNEKLFTDTLYNNIVFDNSNDFNKIVDICYIDELIDSHLGYNKILNEDGFNISGGQKQRIVLARTLIKPFDILLIDEGLNQIDVNLERKILKKIFKVYKDKTIIIISHRLENLDLYDRLITIEKGQITRDLERNGKHKIHT